MNRLFALILVNILWPSALLASPITSDMVISHIEDKGAQSAREEYFSCWDPDKAIGYKFVQTGTSDWLRVAARLIEDSDGCYTDGLQTSISLAQLNNPEAVLGLINSGKKLAAAYICLPFMIDEDDPIQLRIQLNTLVQLERSLDKVRNIKLKERKQQCLTRIRSEKNRINERLIGIGKH